MTSCTPSVSLLAMTAKPSRRPLRHRLVRALGLRHLRLQPATCDAVVERDNRLERVAQQLLREVDRAADDGTAHERTGDRHALRELRRHAHFELLRLAREI